VLTLPRMPLGVGVAAVAQLTALVRVLGTGFVVEHAATKRGD
jgi:hypothetical protein